MCEGKVQVTNHTVDEHLVDLEIRIFQRKDAGYPVEITLGGQQEFPRGHLSADVLPWTPSSDLSADGQRLLDTLLADANLRSAWAEARGQAPHRRIRLRIDTLASELHTLPWEQLQDGPALLSAHADTPFSRYLPIALPWGGPVDERPIRLLVLISDPADIEQKYGLPPADVDLERSTLQSAFDSADPTTLQVDFLEPPITLERLEQMLRDNENGGYHIIHYVGHGAFSDKRAQAVLYLQDDDGNTRLAFDDQLAQLLARQGIQPRLIFLSACQSASRSSSDAFLGLAPKLVSVGVPAVVAMQDLVSVESTLIFSQSFYQRLLEHGQVDLAVNEARSSLLTADRPDAAVPVLFMRLKSGSLWGAEADARGQILGTRNPRVFWSGLIRMIQQSKCTPIIGHRVHGRWLPLAAEIATAWAGEHDYPFSDSHDLPHVAQYLASHQGDDFPRYELLDAATRILTDRLPQELRPDGRFDSLTQLIQSVGWQHLTADDPNDVHRVLASLNLPLYLTTNYDNFMVEALSALGKQPSREICRWHELLDGLPSLFEDDPDYQPTLDAPLVYHLLGSDEEPDSLVLTQDHYLDYLVQVSAAMERIPHYIWAALANSSLMFLGFSLDDWEFRVIIRGLVATREQRRRFKHVAVQLETDDDTETDSTAVQTFLQQYFQDAEINVFWGSVQQFVAELREQWEVTGR